MQNFDLAERTILLTVAGSRAYGIHTPSSDLDIKGVVIPPKEFYHGILNNFDQTDKSSEINVFSRFLSKEELTLISDSKLEGTIFELQKFMILATDSNPNILDVIFCRPQEIRKISKLGEILLDHRDLFISALAKHRFSGYAISQLKRIKTHRRWLLNPPDHLPTRQEFKLPEHTIIPADQLEAASSAIQKKVDSWELDLSSVTSDAERLAIRLKIEEFLMEVEITNDSKWQNAARSIGYSENFIHLLDRERRYNAAATEWKHYNEWKAKRNPERAALESKYGFDCKHAMHLVRLLKMGNEILATGKVNVWRGDIDSEELLAIRNGLWDYDTLIAWASESEKTLDEIYRLKKYIIPHSPDRKKIDALCIKLIEDGISQ